MYESSIERPRRCNISVLFIEDTGLDGAGVDVRDGDVERATFEGEDFRDRTEGRFSGGVDTEPGWRAGSTADIDIASQDNR